MQALHHIDCSDMSDLLEHYLDVPCFALNWQLKLVDHVQSLLSKACTDATCEQI